MNIFELESFNLADAVKFHDRLNHRLWDRSEHLHPQVRDRLMAVARDFQEFLGVPDLDVKDITVSGSNAAYNYTDNSDIDLHLVVEIPPVEHDEVYRELFNAKKYQYNDQHNIRIGGADVELYAQPSDQAHHSQGIYSLLRNAWIQVPRRRKVTLDDSCVQAKYQDLTARINDAIASGDSGRMRSLQKKIKTMRQTGLEQQGEFGCDNLVFKMLRAHGAIQKLIDARNRAHAQELSLAEKSQKPAPVIYGFVTESPDGVDPSTKMFLEDEPDNVEQTVRDFIDHTAQQLGIVDMPHIVLHDDPEWSTQEQSFGRYTPETHTLEVNLHGRHIMDILRTTAHELTHCRQNQDSQLPDDAGHTGSPWEDEAHAMAGVIMRNYADQNPQMFESSGYIPTEAEKNDPRFSMALSPDVRPGATGLNANRMSLKTDAQGRPQMLRADGRVDMVESRMPQPSRGPNNNRDLNAPLGPEFRPTMPKGTVRVDVSDVYDWYKLGKNIPNLAAADNSQFGKGPPSTIVSFGDEDLEHQYIAQLKKLGLDTTDIDPVDPNQPPNMPRQKVDPTYNVNEDSGTASAQQVLAYINRTHHEPLTPDLQRAVRRHAQWQLQSVPLSSLHIPDQEYDDEDQEPEADPYNRVQVIDPEHAGEYSANFVDRRPIVVDSRGWIIDGNHRAWAAAELLNRDSIQAWVPATKSDVSEAFDRPYKGKWEHGDESHDMLVRLPDGSNLSIMFSLDYGAYGDEEWTVEFWRGNSQDVTGGGDQQRIFATVLGAIQKFINKYHPERLRFSANKAVDPGQKSMSRTNLYNRLVQRYANSWGYSVDVDDFADTTVYNLHTMNEGVLAEAGLKTDVPNEEWLADKIAYAKKRGRDSFGVPYMGSTTAYVREPSYVELPVDLLARIPGARGEQTNVRHNDLEAIMKIMKDTGKLPLTQSGKEYMPFITVAWNGEPWVSEGNHRIMAAKRLGWKTLPVELKYFDGGERIRSGPLYPGRIGLGDVKDSRETDENPLVVVYDKDGELHTHANLSVANNIFRTNVKPDDVFKGPVKVKSGGSYGEVTFALSKHHKSNVAENFADGRNPQDKGDSKRYGVPTKASVSTLRKVAKQGGRKGQLAHWMANMKAGRAKARRGDKK